MVEGAVSSFYVEVAEVVVGVVVEGVGMGGSIG